MVAALLMPQLPMLPPHAAVAARMLLVVLTQVVARTLVAVEVRMEAVAGGMKVEGITKVSSGQIAQSPFEPGSGGDFSLAVAAQQECACCEEGCGCSGQQDDGVTVGGLHCRGRGLGVVEALGAALE